MEGGEAHNHPSVAKPARGIDNAADGPTAFVEDTDHKDAVLGA